MCAFVCVCASCLSRYTEIYYAFAFLDHGDERDNRVTEDEFAKNGKSFFDALGYTAEETAELDMHEEFAMYVHHERKRECCSGGCRS